MTKLLGITMGDPAGIGPELSLRALGDSTLLRRCVPVVFGDFQILGRVSQMLNLPLPNSMIRCGDLADKITTLDGPTVVDMQCLAADEVEPGNVSAATGSAAFTYINAAIDAALARQITGVVTGPINKEAFHAADIKYPGHTEIFVERTQTQRWAMMLTSREITCSLVTTHVGLAEVANLLTTERILEVIELSDAMMRHLHSRPSRITVCGLNPHAGEGGLFGRREEEQIILPAIQQASIKGIAAVGPLPPDTAFLPSYRAETDCYVCMYHDQGLIPLKTLAFDTAVNTTLGLPIVRTSVDHGTALDIAWQGKASYSSMQHAIDLAIRLTCAPG